MQDVKTYTLVIKDSPRYTATSIAASVEARLNGNDGAKHAKAVVARQFPASHETLLLVHSWLDSNEMYGKLAEWLSETGLPPYPEMTLLWYR